MKQLLVQCVFLLVLLPLSPLEAQDTTTNPVFLGVKPQYGFIIPHSNKIRGVSSSNPYGLEFDYGWVLTGQQDWHRCNCYSRAGFSLLHANFGNPGTLGSSTSLMMFAEPYFNYQGNVLTSLRMGVGPSYLSRIYDREKNPENLFFSSHLSFIIHLDMMVHFRLDEQWSLNIFGKYNHISNGGIDEPNKGMNFPTFGIGVDHMMGVVEMKPREPLPLKGKGVIPSLAAFATMKNVGQDEVKKRTYGYGFILKGRKGISRLNALNVGVEYLWDGEIREKSESNDAHRQISLLAGHDLTFGKFVFSQYWGTYIYAPHFDRNFYQRYSLTYQLAKHWHAGVTLKAHAEVAQNFNVLIRYRLQ